MTPSRRASGTATFRRVRLRDLLEHEEIDPQKVDELVDDLRRTKVVTEPIWVAAGSGVILNGHHRVAALRRLGTEWAPAWVIDYGSPDVRLDRWTEGPPIDKAEVERRAREHRLFPPKTTRHSVLGALADRPTPLAELMGSSGTARGSPQPRASRSPRRKAAASDTT